jgi:hypothetical protein
MHLVVEPLTLVMPAISPNVNSITMNIIVKELAIVVRAVSPKELACSVLLSLNVLPFI